MILNLDNGTWNTELTLPKSRIATISELISMTNGLGQITGKCLDTPLLKTIC